MENRDMEDQPKDLVHRTKAARRAYLDALDTCEDLADARLNPTRREFALSQRALRAALFRGGKAQGIASQSP
jgi:hypothetical protein